jgi:hypothetical protein
MGNYLNRGNSGFKSIRRDTYVDKTGLISYINETIGTMRKLTCVSRPRRFGKSFAAKMLCAYYDKSCDSRELFEDLKIGKDSSFEQHLNKYDVLYLDMTWFISCASDISNVVEELQDKVSCEIREAYPDVPKQGTLLETLAAVSTATGNKFIVIIDEWDALFREAKENTELQEKYIKLLRGMFKSSLTDDMIEAAYITGILPIKKYGTQSAMTDFIEYTMISPMQLEEYVGFTEDEVKDLCDRHNIDFNITKHWYDGYSFRNVKSVYNPNSVMRAVTSGEFNNYWTKTETYESLKMYIDMNLDGLKEAVVQMLGGAHFPINTDSFQNDLTSIECRDDVLTLLIHLGYLGYDAQSKCVFIPNEEVRQEFLLAARMGKHTEIVNMIKASDRLLEATLDMDEETVARAIEEAHSAGCAPLYYNNEQALRSVIKFAYISCVDEFVRIEELPSGRGYADVVYLPKKGSVLPIMIIELKWNRPVKGAIEQIKQRNYPQVLEDFENNMILVGISYDEKTKKHECVIEEWKIKGE